MRHNEPQQNRRGASLKRYLRCVELIKLMGAGYRTLEEVAVAKKGTHGYGYSSLKRLAASPEMEEVRQELRDEHGDFLNGLILRQLDQIEHGGLLPGAQLSFRAGVIAVLKPRDIKVTGQIEQKVEVDKPVIKLEDIFNEYGDAILDEFMRRRIKQDRGDGGSDSTESLASRDKPTE